jgi:hypothetical protein
MTRRELKELFPNASESFLRRTADEHRADPSPDGVPPTAVVESGGENDPVGTDAGEVAYQGRCLVSITSFRLRLCDERNLYDKHFVDALKEAGAFVDDSPKYVQVEVGQVQVKSPHEERTLIVMTPCQ